ncbi:thiol reductant ABC exporter subunit CydC [Microvirga flavescens]|uniref:thiol reductant ABC exporter subunit CydC n=1 Tax=Microvirga flavescens TaxID=2249811 RepID=UPI000DD9BB2E|nr:thiol reductant ABC exporter subunit CydC [Microvirga flavescens]
MSALLFLRQFFMQRLGVFLAALGLSIITLAAGTALLGVSGWFLTGAALTGAGIAFNLFGPSALVRGLSMLRIVSRYFEKLIGHDATLSLLSALRGWQFRALIPRVPLSRKGIRHGDLVSRLTADIDALDTVFLTAVGPILSALAVGCVVTAVLATLVPTAGLAYAIGFIVTTLVLPSLLVTAARGPGDASTKASAALRMRVFDGIEGHSDLLALGAVPWAKEEFASVNQALSRAKGKRILINALGSASTQIFAGATLLVVLWFGLDALSAGKIEGPLLVGLLFAVLATFEVAGAVARYAGHLGAAQAAARRVREISASEPTVRDPGVPRSLPRGNDVSFDKVRFSHEPGRLVLNGIDLRVESGERVAILGPSGSGKSTMLGLLLRLMDADNGTISVAGTHIREVPQAALHRRVALLSQNTPVFLGTVRDNLLIGDPGADEADCWRALEVARLDSFVRILPEGLDTWLGESGRTLSAGQARRLCLARVLLSPAAVIALDEPTSGLDRETEQSFLTDLAHATAGRTVLIATHAQLPEGAVDRAYQLEAGRLVACQ